MKRIQFKELGMPSDVLSIEEVAMPEPGPGEVRIKVSTCNINPSDLLFIQGIYGIQPQLPCSAGFEAAGTIDKAGKGVQLSKGMRVIFSAIGVWSEYVIVAAHTIVPTPESMSDDVACQAFINPYTAYGMLQQSGLKEDQWLMLTAGGSAFGKFVIQMCQQKGINTICTVRRNDHIDELKNLGATVVINTEENDLIKTTHSITDNKGVNAVFDAVGGDLAAHALDCLANNGQMFVFGLLSMQDIPVNSATMVFKNLSIKGFWLTQWLSELSKEETVEVTKTVLGLLASNQLKANVEARYGIDDIKKAVLHADAKGRIGKIILDMNS